VKSHRSFVLLMSATAVAGCVPTRVQLAPAVTGHVYLEGAPLSGVEVHLLPWFRPAQCVPSSVHASTAPDGAFSLPAPQKTEWIFPLADQLFTWAVCISYRGQWVLGYAGADFGALRRTKLHLRCEVARVAAVGANESHGENRAICRLEVA
jgi:hypothetical protein